MSLAPTAPPPAAGVSPPERRAAGSALDRAGVAVAAIGAVLLATAGLIGLLEPTETRYAEIAREMRASGDYLTPRLDGLPHFHKPPLPYWSVAAGFAALGENAWGARVPATLCAIAVLALTPLVARRRFPGLGIPAALAVWCLGASAYFLGIGRAVASDPFLALGVMGFWAFAPSAWAWLALALGFMAKGPVVFVLTLLPLLAAAAWGKSREPLRLLAPRWGPLLFAAAALPWYLLAAARTPGLVRYFLHDQIWERYATESHQRGGPPGYFVAVLLIGALPWTPALIAGLGRLWRERGRAESRLLLCWLLAPIVFLSFSGSKLPAYILPCVPAAALIAARGWGGRAVAWSGAALLAALAVAGWLAGPRALGDLVGLAGPAPLPAAAHASLACLAAAAALMARARPAAAGLAFVAGFGLMTAALAPFEGPLGSPRPVARLLRESRAPGEPVVEFRRFNAGLPFHLGETVLLLEVPREGGFESAAFPFDPRIGRDSLAALAARHPRVWSFGPPRETAALAESLGLRYQPMARWRKSALGVLSR